MRLFLLPISTRRTFIYCERVQEQLAGAKPPLSERVINRASETWAKWERAEKGWQKHVANWGNQLFRRIPYEEWGLKSIPPATKQRIRDIDNGKLKFECLYPGKFLKENRVPEVLKQLAIERQSLHSRNLWWCFVGMPISFPFTFVPIIPNLPFYYLCFRAWSHYRALYGAKLLQHLTSKNLITTKSSSQLDESYAIGLLNPTQKAAREAKPPSKSDVLQEADIVRVAEIVEAQTKEGKKDVMLLQKWNAALLAESFKLPAMEIEIERAVEQVEKAIKSEEELVKDKEEQVQKGSQNSTQSQTTVQTKKS